MEMNTYVRKRQSHRVGLLTHSYLFIFIQSYSFNPIGTIDATADTALRDSIFGPQPPEMDKNSLTADDLHVNFTLDDAPVRIL